MSKETAPRIQWGSSSDEMVFALPHESHDVLPLLAELDETFIEHPPFEGFI